MAGLLDLPEDVMRHHLFPVLRHNDMLRVRRVCKMTKEFATAYLRTPKKGHQGQWTLEIKPGSDDKNLQAFLQMKLPPPSCLNINLSLERSSSSSTSANFFEDANLNEFMRIYSEHVTHLKITRIEIPFMSTKEIGFYESLVNLKHLYCDEIKTGGDAEFKKKLEIEGSVLGPSTFRKLQTFGFSQFLYWNAAVLTFVRELESLKTIANVSLDDDQESIAYRTELMMYHRSTWNKIPFLLSLVEDDACKVKNLDWKGLYGLVWSWNRLEILRLFVLCSDKGIRIKNLHANFLEVLLCNENGVVDTTEIRDEETRELVYRVNYQRNSFVGNVIYSLDCLSDFVYLMELPFLEELLIRSINPWLCTYRKWERHGDPKWPNLRKMDITVDNDFNRGEHSTPILNFLCGRVPRHKLEELSLRYELNWERKRKLVLPLPCPLDMARSFKNLKTLKLENFPGDCLFFGTLWEGLLLLEDVQLLGCRKLGNEGFLGYCRPRGAGPVFLKLEKLKHLSIGGIHEMPWLTDAVFREVFSRMELKSLKLSGGVNLERKPKLSILIFQVSVEGIKALLTDKFAENIEKLDFEELYLEGVSEDEKRDLKSRFRSSKML